MLLNEQNNVGESGHTRVVAPDYATAVRILQERFGSDWTVVHSRKVRRPGLFGWIGLSDVVVIVRTQESDLFDNQIGTVESSSGQLAPLVQGEIGKERVPSAPEMVPVTAGNFEASPSGNELVYRLEDAKIRIAEELKSYSRTISGQQPYEPWSSDDESHAAVVDEVPQSSVKIQDTSTSIPYDAPVDPLEKSISFEGDPKLVGAVRSLCDEIAFTETASNFFMEKILADSELGSLAAEQLQEAVTSKISGYVMDRIPEVQEIRAGTTGRPKVVALVGPTGVGKTTTLAKLAAHFQLVEKKRVGLVTLDCYRIGAIEQLRRYAEILGLPLRTVTQPGNTAEAIEGFSDCDVILVDTAGRSQKDQERLVEVRDLLGEIGEVEVHLCLSLATAPEAMFAATESFRLVGYDRIIFTKRDESYRKGYLWDLFGLSQAPVSYVTCGQEVPEDIQEATREDICEMIVQGR